MNATSSWKPILDGELGAKVGESIQQIAQAVREQAADKEGPSYASGTSGVATFFTYLAEAFPERADLREYAEQQLDKAVDAVAEMPLPAAFYGGFTGVAWVYEHLQGRLFAPSEEDLNEGIDDALAQLLEHTPWQFDYDLISGLVGFGVYVVERKSRPRAAECAEKIVTRLAELAVEQRGGLTWHTPATLMIPETAERYPDGYYNLGLAHGVPGVVGMLGQFIAAGLGGPDARRLLDGGVAWLLACQRPNDDGSAFGYYVDPRSEEAGGSRSAWCYGDPGAMAALFIAARAVGEPSWEKLAVDVVLRDTRRPRDKAGVVDAGLCHGAGGLAHIYNRFYQATGDETFADAARYWYGKTLDLRRDGGVAGYFAWAPARMQPGSELSWLPETGLLTGACGVGLALLAAVSSVTPDWDRPLLTDIAPRT